MQLLGDLSLDWGLAVMRDKTHEPYLLQPIDFECEREFDRIRGT